jgi:hypothetical protein
MTSLYASFRSIKEVRMSNKKKSEGKPQELADEFGFCTDLADDPGQIGYREIEKQDL